LQPVPHVAIWQELRGVSVIPLELGEKHDYQSISKTKTFTRSSWGRAGGIGIEFALWPVGVQPVYATNLCA
jgi:hypothetical protein